MRIALTEARRQSKSANVSRELTNFAYIQRKRNHFESGRAGDKFTNGAIIYLTAAMLKVHLYGPLYLHEPIYLHGTLPLLCGKCGPFTPGPYATMRGPFTPVNTPPRSKSSEVVCVGSEFLL